MLAFIEEREASVGEKWQLAAAEEVADGEAAAEEEEVLRLEAKEVSDMGRGRFWIAP